MASIAPRSFRAGLNLVRQSIIRTRVAEPSTPLLPARARAPAPARLSFARFASSSSSPLSPTDPTLDQAHDMIDQGTKELEEGNLEGAKKSYLDSIRVKETSGAWFNLGVCEYHMKNNKAAIEAWEKSIALDPSADAYTNMASAYVLAQPPQPALAIKHLTSALELTPNDPEIAFNLAAVLESTDNLETALKMYEKAKNGGIERAAQNIRNVGAKIITKNQKREESK